MRPLWCRVVAQQVDRLFLSFLDDPLRNRDFAARTQKPPRLTIEGLEQLPLPRIPDLGTGSADIGDGEEIQGRQVAFVADDGDKTRKDIRVGNVLFLGDTRHDQMLAHEPDDHLRFGFAKRMLFAKNLCVDRTQFGMTAATPFGDIVEDGRDVQQPRACGDNSPECRDRS